MDERPTFTVPGTLCPGKLLSISPLSAVSVPPRRYHFVPLQSGVGCTAFAAKKVINV